MARYASPEAEWQAYLDGTHPSIKWGRRTFRHVPSGPRCKVCYAPFGPPGGAMFRWMGFTPWEKNPNVCLRCLSELAEYEVMGAEVEISFMFADVRRSSDLARRMGTMEFTHLMQRFYVVANDALIDNDAIIDKFVGDEVVGFFAPFMAGPEHARRAVDSARNLFRSVGYGSEAGPWLPLGAGVHTGPSFVGFISRGLDSEFTALGDTINVAAHLAAQARAGEILITEAVGASLETSGLERRHLSLKGHELDALVISVDERPTASVEVDR